MGTQIERDLEGNEQQQCPQRGLQRVICVEPDPAMRSVAREKFDGEPSIVICSGTAEATGLPAGSLDLIVIGNAFHRFQPESCKEFHRILKTPGWAAIFSYRYTNICLANMLFTKIRNLSGWAERRSKAMPSLPLEALFKDASIETRCYHQAVSEDWQAFFGSSRAGIEAPMPDDAEFDQFEALHRQVFEAFAVEGTLRIEYETQVWLGRLK